MIETWSWNPRCLTARARKFGNQKANHEQTRREVHASVKREWKKGKIIDSKDKTRAAPAKEKERHDPGIRLVGKGMRELDFRYHKGRCWSRNTMASVQVRTLPEPGSPKEAKVAPKTIQQSMGKSPTAPLHQGALIIQLVTEQQGSPIYSSLSSIHGEPSKSNVMPVSQEFFFGPIHVDKCPFKGLV